jgi:hypothetical protein
MPNSSRRRITLSDVLVLIAATAAALALLRISMSGIRARPMSRSSGTLIASYISTGQSYAGCFLPPLTLAILALNFRKPRVSIRRLARGPGFIACAAATTGVVLYSLVCALQIAVGKLSLDPASVSRITMSFASYALLMVAGAWLSLALGTGWRSETSWVGWAGRVLGIVWICLFLAGWIRVFV